MDEESMPRSGVCGEDGMENDTWRGYAHEKSGHTALHEENSEHDDSQRLLVNTRRRSCDVRSDDADDTDDEDDDDEEKASGGVGAIWLTFFSSALVGTQLAWALQVRQHR